MVGKYIVVSCENETSVFLRAIVVPGGRLEAHSYPEKSGIVAAHLVATAKRNAICAHRVQVVGL